MTTLVRTTYEHASTFTEANKNITHYGHALFRFATNKKSFALRKTLDILLFSS